jgi:UDP-N-acetylmuramate: L-alanyl-gamma-D-glutamyl-meso-diaminopimelate ligase
MIKKVHLIAIGGSAMHNMAIALHKKGYEVSGSDDEIFEPSKTRLSNLNLLPNSEGWDENRIHPNLDAVIVGMHARIDNPELLKAQELGLKIYSYPEYIFEQAKNKTRVVIGGSHGKTSITSMILHVLGKLGRNVDYMVGAQLAGFDCMVKFSEDAEVAIIEGDEYLSSPTDLRPKFHLYSPNIAVISGIAWDHINVFPTFENYVDQFKIFTEKITPSGTLIFCNLDNEVKRVAEGARNDLRKLGYGIFPHKIVDGVTLIELNEQTYPLEIFGNHNLQNLYAAYLVCKELGVSDNEFTHAIQSFTGAAKRLELVKKNSHSACYKDFAHSPSKLKATTQALRNQFPNRKLIACMELHTFSSLNKAFLNHYKGAMDSAHEAIVYYNEHTISHKKLAAISPEEVKEAFGLENLTVITNTELLLTTLKSKSYKNTNLLMMSSGNFDGIQFDNLIED